MFSTSYKIGTIFGIPIKLDMSLIILFIMLFDPKRMLESTLITIGLLISIVLHELGHSLVAIKYGCRIREIVLMFMGGAAVMERIPRKPYQEFLMAAAGPAVSLLVGIACIFTGGTLLHYPPENTLSIFIGSEGLAYVVRSPVLVNIGVINLVLVVFNLIPAFPMDGGRIFRSMLTPKFGRLRATRYASNLGKLMAVLFIVKGITDTPTDWLLLIIGIFIFISAGNEYKMVVYEETLRNNPFSPFFESIQQDTPEEPDAEIKKEGRTSPDDDKVTISPPPYRKGEEDKTDISYDRKNPFDDFFRRKR